MLRNQKKKKHQKLNLGMNSNLKEKMEHMQMKTQTMKMEHKQMKTQTVKMKPKPKKVRMFNKRHRLNHKHCDYFLDYVNI